jgi:hypothetical protein
VARRLHDCTAACTAGWQPGRKSHCRRCGSDFTTPSNFDKHFAVVRDELKCLHPTTVGLTQNAKGVWHQPGETDVNERFGR